MTEEQLQNIKNMEEILNKMNDFNRDAEHFLEKWKAFLPEIQKLDQYHGSEQWWNDYHASNNDEIPSGIPHGVLSEDLTYDALGEHHRLAINFLKLVTKIIAQDRENEENF